MWPWENGVRSLFSAHAEVIPGLSAWCQGGVALLRACGGNSPVHQSHTTVNTSSPRMRR